MTRRTLNEGNAIQTLYSAISSKNWNKVEAWRKKDQVSGLDFKKFLDETGSIHNYALLIELKLYANQFYLRQRWSYEIKTITFVMDVSQI